jgi:hypothetical protein
MLINELSTCVGWNTIFLSIAELKNSILTSWVRAFGNDHVMMHFLVRLEVTTMRCGTDLGHGTFRPIDES